MKFNVVLSNLLPIVLFLIHTLLAKYDIDHYMTSTSFSLVLISLLPLVYSIINYCLSNTIINLVVLNVIFVVSQLVGFIIYDIIMVGSISDTYGLLSISMIFYVLVLTVISVLIKVVTRKRKSEQSVCRF